MPPWASATIPPILPVVMFCAEATVAARHRHIANARLHTALELAFMQVFSPDSLKTGCYVSAEWSISPPGNVGANLTRPKNLLLDLWGRQGLERIRRLVS